MYFYFGSASYPIYPIQRHIEYLKEEAKQKSEVTVNFAMKLDKKNEEISQLEQIISSQEEKIQEQGISLHQKSLLLNNLTTLVQQLCTARDEQQSYEIKKRLCNLAANYYQKQAEELRSMVSIL